MTVLRVDDRSFEKRVLGCATPIVVLFTKATVRVAGSSRRWWFGEMNRLFNRFAAEFDGSVVFARSFQPNAIWSKAYDPQIPEWYRPVMVAYRGGQEMGWLATWGMANERLWHLTDDRFRTWLVEVFGDFVKLPMSK